MRQKVTFFILLTTAVTLFYLGAANVPIQAQENSPTASPMATVASLDTILAQGTATSFPIT